MISLATAAVEETKAVAEAVAGRVSAGDLLLLSGDLGTGKTAFVQGFSEALGVADPVTSPTFTLAHRYEGRLIVHHLDVYRLSRLSEVFDLAIPELLDGNSVMLIEWGDVIVPALPPDYLEIGFALGDGPNDRRITLQTTGSGWGARQRVLDEALAPWVVTAC